MIRWHKQLSEPFRLSPAGPSPFVPAQAGIQGLKTGSPPSRGRTGHSTGNHTQRDEPMTSRHDPTDHPAATPLLRWLSNLMGLSHVCARAKCRRAHACCGKPRICLARSAPLVPEDAREGVKAMLDRRERGLSFDQARAEFAEIGDLIAWQQRVGSCAARSRGM
jgi:hypothetical protein